MGKARPGFADLLIFLRGSKHDRESKGGRVDGREGDYRRAGGGLRKGGREGVREGGMETGRKEGRVGE